MPETEDRDEPLEVPAAEEGQAGAPEAEAPPAEEPAAEEPAAEEPAAEEETLTPKQRRKLERSRASGSAGPERSAQERAAERAQLRSGRAAERARWRRKRRERRSAAGGGPASTPPEPRAAGTRKVRRGVVVSAKPDKTITVRIDMVRPHPRYGKIVRNTSTLHAHDESNQANEGDVVRVVETRPLSRSKRWLLLEVVEKAR